MVGRVIPVHRPARAGFWGCRAPPGLVIRPMRRARYLALAVPLSACLSGLAFGKDNGDDQDDSGKPKPALPNIYLDMRTIYSTVPAGALSIGFSAPPLLATLSTLSALPTPTSPSSRNISIDLPLTVDVNDRLS